MDQPRFLDFRVYVQAKALHEQVFVLTSKLPPKYYYLVDQIRRAALSVALNIAEGSAKDSDKDFNRFIQISLGSAYEVVAVLDILASLTATDQSQLIDSYCQLRNQLGALTKKLKNPPARC
ncbi:MAG: four helix bundle protein [Patescibacteria group bacterium]